MKSHSFFLAKMCSRTLLSSALGSKMFALLLQHKRFYLVSCFDDFPSYFSSEVVLDSALVINRWLWDTLMVYLPRSARRSSLWQSWFLKCRVEWRTASWASPSSRSLCILPVEPKMFIMLHTFTLWQFSLNCRVLVALLCTSLYFFVSVTLIPSCQLFSSLSSCLLIVTYESFICS